VSANLNNSNRLAASPWFVGLVRAGLVEYALAHPNDPLSRSMIRDPGYLLPMFTSVVADNPAISADGWEAADDNQHQNDVRYALASNWASLSDAIPNLQPQSARIPVLAADPPSTSEISIWIDSASGDLKVRDAAEVVHTFPSGG